MTLNDLIQRLSSYTDVPETQAVLTSAYEIAESVHRGIRRLNGDFAISHSLAVADILAEWHAPLSVVAVGLLHDIQSPEYAHEYDLSNVKLSLGEDISRVLQAVINLNSFLKKIEKNFDKEGEVEINLRHALSVLQEEPDVLIIKLADRLHNLQTLQVLSRFSQERMARIGFNLLIPLADQLGMGRVKRLLEDYSFEVINSGEYQKIKQQLANADARPSIQNVCDELLQAFTEERAPYEVRWQQSSLYTLYSRQIARGARHGRSLQANPARLKAIDTGWFIVLTKTDADCYQALRLIHKLYQPVKGQFRDLIAEGKENGYRALHTEVRHRSGNSLRIFIRTYDMDMIAECGITARWWNVPETLLPQLSGKSKPIDGDIQVFTSESEIRYLPRGSTVIDFAYSIHTRVGHRCAGALVNSKRVDAYHILQNGDRIEIIKGGSDTRPDLDWLNHVRTSQASGAIRQWLTQHMHSAMLERGRALLNQELRPFALNASDPQVIKKLNRIAAKEAVKGQEDLLVAIGVGRLEAQRIVEQLRSMQVKDTHFPDDIATSQSVRILSSEEALLLPILADCCRPAPSDEIIGIRSNERVIVHKRTCSLFKDVERPIPIEWDTEPFEPHYVVLVEALDRPGLAHDLTDVFYHHGLSMSSFTAYTRPDRVMAEAHIYLGKTTAIQRARLQKALETVPDVSHVEVLHSSLFISVAEEQPSALPLPYISNPYFLGVAKGSRFYGRKLECERIMTYVCDHSENHVIFLWGQKRIGKTSLVVRLQELAKGSFLPVYIDLQNVRDGTSTQFLHLFMNRISLALKEHNAMQEISAPAFGHLKHDPLGHFNTYLSQIQQTVEQRPLVIILDEFQCLCTMQEATISINAIFSRLRSQLLHGQGIHLILSGGGLLSQLLEQKDIVSLFNIAHDVKLNTLELEAARSLIEDKDGLTKVVSITDPAIDFLLWITAGHPYYLKLLCSDLFEKAQEQRERITRDVATSSIHRWIEKADNSRFQHLWEGSDRDSQRRNKLILSAIAELRGQNDEVQYEDLAEAVGHFVPERELVQTLDDLTNLGVLNHVHPRYTIGVKLFTSWLLQHWPLSLTMKEGGWV